MPRLAQLDPHDGTDVDASYLNIPMSHSDVMRRMIAIVETRLQEAVRLPETVLNAAAKHLLNAVNTGHTSSNAILAQMFQDEYIETFDSSEESRRGFRTKLRQWCSDSVHNMAWTLTSKFQGDELPIWRMIAAPAGWTLDPDRHPGIFWSWDRNAAEAHWGNFESDNVLWLLHAKATSQEIDWPATLSKNCMPDYEDEKEIQLLKVPITIIDYERKS